MRFPERELGWLPYGWVKVFFFSALFAYPIVADNDANETLGALSARIEELENRLSGGQGETDDKNPGERVTSEDLERLRDEIRALKDARQPSEDMGRLKEELDSLREAVQQLQNENTALRHQGRLKGVEKTSPSRIEKDEETESLLKLLEESAPDEDEGPEVSSSPKKTKKNDELEEARETATKHAEEGAPSLPVGNAEAQYNEAFALYNKGAYKEAEKAFGYFIKTYPTDVLVTKAMYWKAESCLKQGKHKEAQALFASAYKKNRKGPKAPDCLLKVGELFAIQGRKEDGCVTWLRLETDFPHMTNKMKNDLAALKKKHGCGKKSEAAPKPAPKA